MTNLLASSPTLTPVAQWGGRIRVAGGAFEMDATTAAADIIRLCRLPVNARVWKIELGADTLGSVLTVDVGLYQTNGTVLDADEFADDVVLDAKVFAGDEVSGSGTQLVYQSAATDIVHNGKALWDRAAVAADPGGEYDICLTVVTATDPAAGTIAYTVWYTVD
jgi:hypothetical protein